MTVEILTKTLVTLGCWEKLESIKKAVTIGPWLKFRVTPRTRDNEKLRQKSEFARAGNHGGITADYNELQQLDQVAICSVSVSSHVDYFQSFLLFQL